MTNKQTTKSNTKSGKMIKSWSEGKDLSSIAKSLNVRYNFVYNVVSRYCKKHGLEMDTHSNKGESKKSQIIDLYFNKKMSMNKIAKTLNTNTSYVWMCVNDERLSQV